MDQNNSPRRIDKGAIHLWTAHLDAWKPHTSRLRYLLSDHEIERLNRLKILSKKEEFLSSRGILRIILSRYVQTDPENIQLNSTIAGKPTLSGNAIEFNVSHSMEMFICGLCSTGKIGIDIQGIYSISSMDKIINNYFSSTEVKHLKNLPSSDIRQDHFFAIWTAKEAYMKAVGDGIQENFNQVSIIPETSDIRDTPFSLTDPTSAKMNWTIKSIDLPSGYIGALAYQGDIKEIGRYEMGPEILK